MSIMTIYSISAYVEDMFEPVLPRLKTKMFYPPSPRGMCYVNL